MNRYIIIPPKKYAKQSICALYGINQITATKIIGILRAHPNAKESVLMEKKIKDLIQDTLLPLRIEFRLRLIVFSRLVLILAINSYRGARIMQGLPTKGQRTHANGKSLKNLRQSGKFFPFKVKLTVKKNINAPKTKKQTKKVIKKVTSKQKAKIKAKNKAKEKPK